MAWQATPYTIPLGIAAVITGLLCALAATQRSRKGGHTMMALFGAMAVYAGAYAVQLASTTQGEKLLWHTLRFLGPAIVPLAVFVFALQYTGRESAVTPRNLALLGLVPAVTLFLVLSDYLTGHGLVLGSFLVEEAGGIQRFVVDYGPWYAVHSLYAIAFSVGAFVLFVGHWWQTDGATSKRTGLFAIASIVPVTASFAYVAAYTAIDWGPVTYAFTGVLIVVAIFYY